MQTKKCIAIILAGGRGQRLGALTRYYSKPAIHFGGDSRIIDFALNNCKNSKIETIAVLSQYFTVDLNEYIRSVYVGNGLGRCDVHLLVSKNADNSYKGTADAVYRNFAFIEGFMPENVLILASDHVYRMDYNELLAFHEEKGADVTVASTPVPAGEASRFGIIRSDEAGQVIGFEEKPKRPKGNLASMGIYAFRWRALKEYLSKDNRRRHSNHDFGKDILPETLYRGRLYTYRFNGYWRDVGTVDKLWEANMDQIGDSFSQPHAGISHSILGKRVTVGRGSEIVNSVIMPNVHIGNNVKIINSIIGNHAVIKDDVFIGGDCGDDFFVDHQVCDGEVSLVSPWAVIDEGMVINKNSHVIEEKLANYHMEARGV